MQDNYPIGQGQGGEIYSVPTFVGTSESGTAVTQYIFTSDEQIISYVYHMLKGHRLEIKLSKDGQEIPIWVDKDSQPLVTKEGLQYILGFLRANLSNVAFVSDLPESLIAEKYADIRNDMAKELYVNFPLYFPTDNTMFLASSYHMVIRIISDIMSYLLLGIKKGRILEQVTKRVEEMHSFQHQGNENSSFLGLKKGGV